MRATEQTCYNLKKLHKAFALSSVLLLLATIWMFAVDHNRMWKRIQRTSDRIDLRMTQWRKVQVLSEDVMSERERLEQALSELQAKELPVEFLAAFRAEVRADAERRAAGEPSFAALDESVDRQGLIAGLQEFLNEARFREDTLLRQRKFELAELDVAKAELGLAVRDAKSPEILQRLQAGIDRRKAAIDQLTISCDAAAEHRQRLQNVWQQIAETERVLRKKLDANLAESRRLDQIVEEKQSTYFTFSGILPVPGKKWLELPILDAFNSPRKVDNLWSAGLDQPAGSFGRVRRFDRCTTCHQGVQQELVNVPMQPLFPPASTIDLALELPPPEGDRAPGDAGPASATEQELHDLFGLQLAQDGLLQPLDLTVRLVRPNSLAARARAWQPSGVTARGGDLRDRMLQLDLPDSPPASVAGLLVGDVIVAINGQEVPRDEQQRAWVTTQLVSAATTPGNSVGADAGSRLPIRLTIRRGLPHPYAGHPRLDLFVGAQSPHPMNSFGCTMCHEGQGSATAFEWTSHTPNDPEARGRWRDEYGWFNNPHWDYPMYPRRFAESLCLKCHHRVVDLEASERFPDSPAPKLLEGYRLIRSYGCFGCHEINGFAGPDRRVAPDLRLEPNYYAVGLQFKGGADTGYDKLTAAERISLDQLIANPDNDPVRQQVREMFLADARKTRTSDADAIAAAEQGQTPAVDGQADSQPRFSQYVHQTLVPLLKDQESPGTMRKVGPSLRFLNKKVDATFLADWLQRPAHFRPTTRMPQAFGLWNHLPGRVLRTRIAALETQLADMARQPDSQADPRPEALRAEMAALKQELAQQGELEKAFEPLAIYSIVTYLRERSQAYDYLQPAAGTTPVATADDRQLQIERGRVVFQQSGCLVCHAHADFPDFAKYLDPDAVELGPDLSDTAAKFAPDRNPDGLRWLYSWIKQPARYDVRTTMPDAQLNPVEQRAADGQVVAVTDPVADIVAFLMSRTTNAWQPSPDAVVELDADRQRTLEQLTVTHLRDSFPEVTAQKYALSGIPAEQARLLKGPERELIVDGGEHAALSAADMLKKRVYYVARKALANNGCYACHDIPGMEDARPIGPTLTGWGRRNPQELVFGHIQRYIEQGDAVRTATAVPVDMAAVSANTSASVTQPPEPLPPYFRDELQSQSRIGFIFQKLSEPRSYDFQETQNKKYTARLQMPQFPLSPVQREAVITFVLGLVSDPPTEKFAYAPDSQTKALLDGKEVLSKYNCRGCHLVEPEAWQLAFPTDAFGQQLQQPTFPWVPRPVDEIALMASRQRDRRDLRSATVRGMPAVGSDGKAAIFDGEEFPLEEEEDEEFPFEELQYAFDLWLPAALDGWPYQVGEGSLVIASRQIERRRRSYGGALAKYLLPHVVAREKLLNPNAKGSEAWAWLPPPLIGEGQKVQPAWLNDYLLDPQLIRPAVVMRMPKFNLSTGEAQKLADYFAAKDSSRYPYPFAPERRDTYLAQTDSRYMRQLEALDRAGTILLGAATAGRHLVDAMKIVTSDSYCVKCHRVGDYDPPGTDRVKAPDLSVVYKRLRAAYVRTWIAKPTAILPYASMPVNIPYDASAPLLGSTVSQDLYHGNSVEQLDALVDLLMNYDQYTRQQSRVTPLVAPSSPSAP
ncbi:MAG: hypothetical protein ACYC3X_10315 [Pirellulaceae bacterium]